MVITKNFNIKNAGVRINKDSSLSYHPKKHIFPQHIWIENTNHCNAKCDMCPREKLTRKQGFMDFALYKKIIKEISKFRRYVKRVHLHNYGEPLLDKLLPQRIKLAKSYGVKHAYFVTNGSLFTAENSKQIIKSGLDELKISFNGTDEKSYNATMRGLDFTETIKSINIFIKARDELKRNNPKIKIQYLPLEKNSKKIKDFERIFIKLIDLNRGDRLYVSPLHNFGGGKNYNIVAREKFLVCPFPWDVTVIQYDGKITLCSIDYNGIQSVGDVNKKSIKEIWNGPIIKKARLDFENLDYGAYPVCLKCDFVEDIARR